MIKDYEVAKEFNQAMLDVGRDINVALYRAWPKLSAEEQEKCRLAVGHILGEILDRALNPLCIEHPTLRPPEMDGSTCESCKR
ncbi:hypothetical protein [Burkholderia gladioli]|uniref:hypothetical protein n=1 Tax=Burkholderia gladioli TaxID=28095 RepID=UPI00163E065B|nr:hypothetical protein [Burkholderia gladioli]